ncbi:integrase [Anaerovirgula multivorans]|nr:integrase [Anaerovirgula multivorans]
MCRSTTIGSLGELEEYDEQLARRLIEKVTIFEEKLTVEFKSGVEISIES